jgi:protocatechuate 3,4-dioxygenase alpha subunit
MTTGRTASQTIGPFFGFALAWSDGPWVIPEGTPGAIRLTGRLLDGKGDPVTDGLIETWQADPQGRFPRAGGIPGFRGFGRSPTDREGWYRILTLKPGAVRASDGSVHAPHVAVSVFARGLLKRAVTRIYFSDELAANRSDPFLSGLGDAARAASLIAAQIEGGYRFDIRLQGQGGDQGNDNETIFFDV